MDAHTPLVNPDLHETKRSIKVLELLRDEKSNKGTVTDAKAWKIQSLDAVVQFKLSNVCQILALFCRAMRLNACLCFAERAVIYEHKLLRSFISH